MIENDEFVPRYEDDSLWTSIQQVFSAQDAIYFRSYPVRVFNTVRELDYLIYLRNGTLIVGLKETLDDPDVSFENLNADGVFRVWDSFLRDDVYYRPADLAIAFLAGLQEQFARLNIPIDDTVILIWLPIRTQAERIRQVEQNITYLLGEYVTPNVLRGAIERWLYADAAQIVLEQWSRFRQYLSPPSLIQSLTRRRSREEQQEIARDLSSSYQTKFRKSTLAFISYRRDDAGWPAGRIYSHLEPIFQSNIFFDWASIKPGADWISAIDQALDDSIIQLVVIGSQWATLTNPGSSIPRILEKDDMVAHEVRMALRKKVTTIPLLIDNAPMPPDSALPHGVKQLRRRNGVMLNQDNFIPKMDTIVDRMIDLLDMAVNP